jgi:GntR family transcriptional regulator
VAAKYTEIAAALRSEIRDGTWPANSKLPAEAQLMSRFNVANATLRKALALLQGEGLIEGRHGAGIFVRQFKPIVRNAVRRLSAQVWGQGVSIWAEDIEGRSLDVDRIRVTQAQAPQHIAQALGTEDTWVRERRYLVEGRPVMLAKSHLPAEIVAGSPITEPDPGDGGIYARLLDLGYKPVHFREEIRSRMPTEAEAADLRLPSGTSVLEVARTALTEDGRAVEVNEMLLDARVYVLQYDFTS